MRVEAPARIELATLRLGNECSIQLSYGAISPFIARARFVPNLVPKLACILA
jgi:hypothetical protein